MRYKWPCSVTWNSTSGFDPGNLSSSLGAASFYLDKILFIKNKALNLHNENNLKMYSVVKRNITMIDRFAGWNGHDVV